MGLGECSGPSRGTLNAGSHLSRDTSVDSFLETTFPQQLLFYSTTHLCSFQGLEEGLEEQKHGFSLRGRGHQWVVPSVQSGIQELISSSSCMTWDHSVSVIHLQFFRCILWQNSFAECGVKDSDVPAKIQSTAVGAPTDILYLRGRTTSGTQGEGSSSSEGRRTSGPPSFSSLFTSKLSSTLIF